MGDKWDFGDDNKEETTLLTLENLPLLLRGVEEKLVAAGFNQPVHLMVAGGAVSVLFFRNRQSTEDVDYVIPKHLQNLKFEQALKTAGKEVAKENNLSEKWFNNGPQRLYRDTSENDREVIFNYGNLTLFGPNWIEAFSHKLERFAPNDENDAHHIMKHILKKIQTVKP